MMRKDKKECAFLELMKCGIWGKSPNHALFKGLTASDWTSIYKIAGKQTVLGICLAPVMALPGNLQPPTDLLLQWIGLNRFIEANNRQKMKVWKELNDKLKAAGFTPVVFKGLSVAKWYASPLSRQFSDIDIFIPERFSQLIKQLKETGFQCVHKPQHDTIEYKGVTVEIHSKIITVPRCCQPRLNFSSLEERISEDLLINIPDPNTYSLILLSHAGGHFLIPGIGYRFLCDWAVFLKHNHQKIDTDFVLKESKRMGMLHFVREFTKLAQIQLGLNFEGIDDWTKQSNEKYLRILSDKLFENGDFGAVNFTTNRKGKSIQLGWNAIKSLGSCRYYWSKLFWWKTPVYLFKYNILVLLRCLNFRV